MKITAWKWAESAYSNSYCIRAQRRLRWSCTNAHRYQFRQCPSISCIDLFASDMAQIYSKRRNGIFQLQVALYTTLPSTSMFVFPRELHFRLCMHLLVFGHFLTRGAALYLFYGSVSTKVVIIGIKQIFGVLIVLFCILFYTPFLQVFCYITTCPWVTITSGPFIMTLSGQS